MPWWEDSKDGYENYLRNKNQLTAQPTKVIVVQQKILRAKKGKVLKPEISWKDDQRNIGYVGSAAVSVGSRAKKIAEKIKFETSAVGKLQRAKMELSNRRQEEKNRAEYAKVQRVLQEQRAKDKINNPSIASKAANVMGSLCKKEKKIAR